MTHCPRCGQQLVQVTDTAFGDAWPGELIETFCPRLDCRQHEPLEDRVRRLEDKLLKGLGWFYVEPPAEEESPEEKLATIAAFEERQKMMARLMKEGP